MSHLLEHHSSDHQPAVKGTEVFVGGLSNTVTEGKIQEVFSRCGEIVEVRLIKDLKGNMKGFGFVRFRTKEAADKAVRDISGSMLQGKKIGVLPSADQDTLFLGNLDKGWTAEDFDKFIRQVFPDVVSTDLAMALSTGETPLGKKHQNRGYAFVKFSAHAAAARAYRAGSRPEFLLAGRLHPSVEWVEEEPEHDPDEIAKIKIAFIRQLPPDADEDYLNKLFFAFGKVEKVVVSKKKQSSVGFVHFTQRSDLDDAIRELNGKMVHGPNGGPSFKLQVEVARPMDKKRKHGHDDPQSRQQSEILSQSKLLKFEKAVSPLDDIELAVRKEFAPADPYESAVLLLPVSVKERLLRILRLGIATQFDIDIQCLNSLKELPESTAILVLDQFMLSGADIPDKGAYLAGLISRHQVEKLGLDQTPLSSRMWDVSRNKLELSTFSGRLHVPAIDSLSSYVGSTVARPNGYASRYSSSYSDYTLSSRGLSRPGEVSPMQPPHITSSDNTLYSRIGISSRIGGSYTRLEETSTVPSSMPYGKIESQITASVDRTPTRPQIRFDPFTGEPYKFDPFTGEPIVQETQHRPY